MNVLWFSWKDINHPLAGGAESVSSNIMNRLVQSGHSVTLITASYQGGKRHEVVNGIHIHRTGNRFTVYIKAVFFYIKHLSGWPDLVVDEMNTVPFFAAFFSKKRTVLLTYQLARKVWFYQMPFPISVLGFIIEPLYVRLLSLRYKEVITESESTANDLVRHGFKRKNIKIIRVGIDLKPVSKLPKKDKNRVIFLGAMRPMKRVLDAVRAFEVAKETNPNLTLSLVGDTSSFYAKKVTDHINSSPFKEDIVVHGRVTTEEKLKLLREAGLIVVTSIKEGWGLIVTEANSQGTPAVAYDVDGLRDSIKNGRTGLLAKESIADLGAMITKLSASTDYDYMRHSGWEWSKEMTSENSYKDFLKAIS